MKAIDKATTRNAIARLRAAIYDLEQAEQCEHRRLNNAITSASARELENGARMHATQAMHMIQGVSDSLYLVLSDD